ncbi:hypothetical protein DFW101_0249 [Solidesulfovibrio carbinoliphilus subsp. oakridgensis]|uniref:Uncharacterized protein n=1 Tax=Solidesulfovibrio carbinoliphilus subsp. oakridgensis TaxID=694327 RepID=G7QCW0_9BACT|nr:hypothetical protein [Solidesulfovibrio carbinoliphilus]EHJ46266.1 hypothetical protein DFW101_0249 [Solidesulfovibrio carbinoliphilus subsp. oakridgensis]
MEDVLAHLDTILWALAGKAADFCLNVAILAGRQALDWALAVAGWIGILAAKVAAVPLWVSVPGAVLLVGLGVCYALRQRLYDRVLVYHLVWLRRQGYGKQVFQVRRGAVRKTVAAMARPVPLPDRFETLAVYEAVADRYLVAYGLCGQATGVAEGVRTYRRDRRAGLAAMGADLIRHFRANVRLLHADSELRALFAVLDAVDPDFAACRPALPGERKSGGPGPGPDRRCQGGETAYGVS